VARGRVAEILGDRLLGPRGGSFESILARNRRKLVRTDLEVVVGTLAAHGAPELRARERVIVLRRNEPQLRPADVGARLGQIDRRALFDVDQALFVDDADTAEIADDIKLPPVVRKVVMKVEAVTRDAERSLARMAKAKEQAARKLIATMSVRDAGAVLGVSHQRVQQLVKAKGSSKGRRLGGSREQRL